MEKDPGASVYVSFDGGAHWTRSRGTTANNPVFTGGDPIVYFTRDNTPLFVTIGRVNGMGYTMVSRSADGGRTWLPPAMLSSRDRQWVGSDAGRSMLHGRLYLVGQNAGLIVNQSNDDGRTWTPTDLVRHDYGGPDPRRTITALPGDVTVAPDGTVIVAYTSPKLPNETDPAPPAESSYVSRIRFLVSDDGMRSFSEERAGPFVRVPRQRSMLMAGALRVVQDAGNTTHKGRIYVTYASEERGRIGVYVSHTDDLGKTWKTTIASEHSPTAPPSNAAVAVNRDGVVAVVWNDRRDDPEGACWRLYGTISLDGGATFLPAPKLSDAPPCVNPPGNGRPHVIALRDPAYKPPLPSVVVQPLVVFRFQNGGETQGLAPDANGTFHVAWINESRGGET